MQLETPSEAFWISVAKVETHVGAVLATSGCAASHSPRPMGRLASLLPNGLTAQREIPAFPVVHTSLPTQHGGLSVLISRPKRTSKAGLPQSEQFMHPQQAQTISRQKRNHRCREDSRQDTTRVSFNAGSTPCRHGVYSLS